MTRHTLPAIFDRILDFFFFIATVILALVALMMLADIFLRTFFSAPIIGTIEISGYALLYITFFGAAWLLRDEGHVVVDLVINQMNIRVKRILNIISSIAGSMMCFILTWSSANATWYAFSTNYHGVAELETPLYVVIIAIPIGLFLLAIQFIRRTLKFYNAKA